MSEQAKCQLCGEPMPPGEEMFNFHGYSGPCPKEPLPKVVKSTDSRTFNAERGVSFQRHEETGDVTIHMPNGSVRLLSNTWISAVAEMTVHGAQVNHETFKAMHTGVGGSV
jgi:hypothetical protein